MSTAREIYVHPQFIQGADMPNVSKGDFSETASIYEVLSEILQDQPKVYRSIFDEQDELRPHVAIFLDSTRSKKIETAIKETEVISVLTAVSGG